MMLHRNPAVAAAIALPLALGLSACGGTAIPQNRSLYSVHQPVVATQSFALDLAAGSGGLSQPERQRLVDWLTGLNAGFGDRIAVEGAGASTIVQTDVSGIVGATGAQLSEAAPAAAGIAPGMVRVTLTRAQAHVPGCPDWAGRRASNPGTATSANYGCATNGNLAAMIADPQHLLKGVQDTAGVDVMTSNKAIATYRERPNTGSSDLSRVDTSED